ncbi:lysozyme-like domain containing protein [Marinobacter caseinilyticus]|uniref:transglycosylase SLT domain-containing protein n=1 Tax=Marinobacter caseinilyticus TaxID=2692195 RepID=UPI001F48B850|nr:lysozyme-like domain containing protein [Marinobacter caseinilyticus]
MEDRIRARRSTLFARIKRSTTPVLFLALMTWLVGGFVIMAPTPPRDQDNICEIFREQPNWYDHAVNSQQLWGTPVATQMAFVHYESSFRSHIRPPRTRLFGFIPWRRPSTAYGYAQAQDPAWSDYMDDAGSAFATRDQMKHALDFIGWYNRKTHDQLGISFQNPRHLYYAYHEGRTGYRRKTFEHKPGLKKVADRVASRSLSYHSQLASCEQEFMCRKIYQVWPFCG